MDAFEHYLDSGIAITILISIGVAAYQLAVWAGKSVVMPVVQAHIAFLNTASEAIKTQTALLEHLSEQILAMREVLNVQKARCMAAEEASEGVAT